MPALVRQLFQGFVLLLGELSPGASHRHIVNRKKKLFADIIFLGSLFEEEPDTVRLLLEKESRLYHIGK
mgnify:CR=1 FL=1